MIEPSHPAPQYRDAEIIGALHAGHVHRFTTGHEEGESTLNHGGVESIANLVNSASRAAYEQGRADAAPTPLGPDTLEAIKGALREVLAEDRERPQRIFTAPAEVDLDLPAGEVIERARLTGEPWDRVLVRSRDGMWVGGDGVRYHADDILSGTIESTGTRFRRTEHGTPVKVRG